MVCPSALKQEKVEVSPAFPRWRLKVRIKTISSLVFRVFCIQVLGWLRCGNLAFEPQGSSWKSATADFLYSCMGKSLFMLTSQLVVMPAVTSFFSFRWYRARIGVFTMTKKKSVSWIDWLVFLEWNNFSSKCFILIRCCTVCPIFFSPRLERNLACEFNETRTVICGSLKICCVTISILPNKEGNTDV